MENINIKKLILELSTEEEKNKFVKKRIEYFENDFSNEIVDYENNVFYNNYISSSVQHRYFSKCVKNLGVLYDDVKPFLYFVNKINSLNYDIYSFLFDFSFFKRDYFQKNENLSDDELDYKRFCIYMNYLLHGVERIPIEDFSDEKCAGSTEIAGMCHNILKFLGYDSTLISGEKNGKKCTFNLVYPDGYGNEALLFDSSSDLVLKKRKSIMKYPLFKLLSSDELDILLSGGNLEIKTDLSIVDVDKIPEGYRILEETFNYSVDNCLKYNVEMNAKQNSRIRK